MSRIRVGIDVQSLLGPATGVHRYTAELVRLLPPAAPEADFTLLGFQFRRRVQELPAVAADLDHRPVRAIPGRVYYRLMRHGLEPRVTRPLDLAIFPNFTSWRMGPVRTVPVIHDLAFVRYPEHIERSNLGFLRRVLPRTLRRAWRIVAASEFTRSELIDLMGIEPGRVVVARSPLGQPFRERLAELQVQGLPPDEVPGSPYLLFVGTLEPRKNLAGLLEAFTSLWAARQGTVRLLIAGGFGWRTEGIREALARAETQGCRVEVLGRVPDERLIQLYRGAAATVLFSHHEGFGLPVIEAMASGSPVIVSEVAALPEAAGGAARLVPTGDAASLAEVMQELLDDAGERDRLRRLGLARAARHTEADFVEPFLHLIREARS